MRGFALSSKKEARAALATSDGRGGRGLGPEVVEERFAIFLSISFKRALMCSFRLCVKYRSDSFLFTLSMSIHSFFCPSSTSTALGFEFSTAPLLISMKSLFFSYSFCGCSAAAEVALPIITNPSSGTVYSSANHQSSRHYRCLTTNYAIMENSQKPRNLNHITLLFCFLVFTGCDDFIRSTYIPFGRESAEARFCASCPSGRLDLFFPNRESIVELILHTLHLLLPAKRNCR